MGRLAWYAGISTALAAGVIVSAFNKRVNFYSASVYLAQSNLCLMILINLILFIYGSFMYGLQRLCYGPLRPIEIEQLYEKAWFAITETCLAMTIFREEVGSWFLVMFVALLTGKVWGWIGDGRVEILEQQPPANPRLFHIRLSVSLAVSVLYDIWLMSYTVSTVIQQARPNMMVMFLFEFTILTTSSFSTAFRYGISLIEASIVKKQTRDGLARLRREVSEAREETLRQRAAAAEGGEAGGAPSNDSLPSEDDIEELDVEVPGWEKKGQWVLTLDLITDFFKLCIYLAFFFVLLIFYGLPIHIMRDLFMTTRSFVKRLTAFLRYRRATHDMNKRYDDASVEDIQREDTCIICREEMRPWSVTNPPPNAPGVAAPARPTGSGSERSRPKKLPCGHILHLGCLKSWLERQQVCPTCRRPVVENNQTTRAAANNANLPGQGAQPPAPAQQGGGPAAPPAAGQGGGRGMRMLNIGPLRVGFGQANLQDLAQGFAAPQPEQQNAVAGGPRVYGLELGFPRHNQPQQNSPGQTNPNGAMSLQEQLQQLEQQILSEIRSLQLTQTEIQLVQLLQTELARLRLLQNRELDLLNTGNIQMPQMPQLGPLIGRSAAPFSAAQQMQRYGRPNTSAIPSGSADLPPGVSIPEGWSLLPLQRLDGLGLPHPGLPGRVAHATPNTTTTIHTVNSPIVTTSNTTVTPTPTTNLQSPSHASSVGSSDTNAINTPPSATLEHVTSTASMTTGPNAPVSNTVIQGPPTSMDTSPPITSLEPSASHPSALPNWGSSQLLSRPSLTAHSTNTGSTPLQSASESAGPVDAGSSTSVSTEEPRDNSEERRRDGGTAMTATVEDVVDESEP